MEITRHLRTILEKIKTEATTLVVAPTGSGKSVGIPAAIAISGSTCYVSVPTRTAAVSLASYQTTIQARRGGVISVGYAADAEIHYDDNTQIVYATSGHIRKKMLSYFNDGKVSDITFCDVLFVDEIHSGSLDNTVILSLWMAAAEAQVNVPRLLLASATPIPLDLSPAPEVYTVDLKKYPVKIIYDTIDYKYDKVLAAAANRAVAVHNANLPPKSKGHILVFAAGSSEVQKIAQDINDQLVKSKTAASAKIIPVFGALKQSDIATIYDDTPPEVRKIIIATNIAETAITIDNLAFVIDSLYEKRAETSKNGGLRLTTRYISKDSAAQRTGRTGRTMPGTCYRLCRESTFDSFEDHRPAEIDRVPIYEVVMDIIGVGLDPNLILPQSNKIKIANSITLLKNLQMISLDDTVTEIGRFASHFPISVRNSRFIWDWIERKLPPFVGIVLASLMDCYGPSYFYVPRKDPAENPDDYRQRIEAHNIKYMSKYVSAENIGDLEVCINLWLDLTSAIKGYSHHARNLPIYCRDNSLNAKQIKELLKTVQQCTNGARRFGLKFKEAPFTRDGAMAKVEESLLKAYPDRIMYNQRDQSYYNPDSKEIYRLDRNMVGTYYKHPPPALIAVNTTEIMSGGRSSRVISFAVSTETYDRDIAAKSTRSNTSRTTSRYNGYTRPQLSSKIASKGSSSAMTQADDDLLNSLLGIEDDTTTTSTTTQDNAFDLLDSLLGTGVNTTINTVTPIVEPILEPIVEPILEETIDNVEEINLNPPFDISTIMIGSKQVQLVNDHKLYIGTYQRGLDYFVAVKDASYNHMVGFFYPHDRNQEVFAWCCASAGIGCHIYTTAETSVTELAQQYGATIYLVDTTDDITALLEDFTTTNTDAMALPNGLFDESYISYLAAGISQVTNFDEITPKVIWVMDDIGVLVGALAMLYPDAMFNIVTLSAASKIKEHLPQIKHKIYTSRVPIIAATTDLPKYESDKQTDAKSWAFIKLGAKAGDYIWNSR